MSQWEMSEYVLARTSGAEQSVLAALRLDESLSTIERVHRLRRWLESNRAHVCDDVLYGMVGECGGTLKAKLVGIRRKLFNQKLPSVQDVRIIMDLGTPRSRRAVVAYYLRLRRYLSLVSGSQAARHRGLYEAELVLKREKLVAHLRDPRFMKALQVASPSLAESVAKLTAKPPSTWAKKERQVEVRAIRYLTRMVAKTSPFGRFGPVALARYDHREPGVLKYDLSDASVETVSSLNLSFVDRIIENVWRHPAVADHLPLKVNETCFVDNHDLCFFSPYEKKGIPKYTILRRGRFLREIELVVRCVESTSARMTARQLAEALGSSELGASFDDPAKVLSFVHGLITSGLLVRQWDIPTNHPDRLGELLKVVDAEGVQLPTDLRERIERLRQLGSQFAALTGRERERAIHCADTIMNQVLAGQPDLKDRIARDRRLFVEDSYLHNAGIVLGRRFWETVRRDVGTFLDLIFRRDRGGLGYQMLKDIFLQNYGEGGSCSNLSKFGNELGKTAFRSEVLESDAFANSAQANENALSYFKWLGQIHNEAGDAAEYDIGAGRVGEFCAALPDFAQSRQSIALHLQFVSASEQALADGDFDVVLNYTLPGHGRFFSRYCDYFDAVGDGRTLSDQLRAQLTHLGKSAGDIEVMEFVSIVNHNAQLHRPLTTRSLLGAGEIESPFAGGGVAMRDMELRHDPGSGEMRMFASGKEVLPVYMGFFHSMSLPHSHRAIVDASPHSYHAERNKFSEFAESMIPFTAGDGGGRAIRHYPRIRCGRLVIQRRSWVVEIGLLVEKFLDRGDDYRLFQDANLWRLDHGMPQCCFVRIRRRREAPSDVYNPVNANEHKPMLLDFGNFFTLRSLAAACSSPGVQSVHFEEALPSVGDSPLRSNGAPLTLELQVEVNKCGLQRDAA